LHIFTLPDTQPQPAPIIDAQLSHLCRHNIGAKPSLAAVNAPSPPAKAYHPLVAAKPAEQECDLPQSLEL
tara:strand:- start:342 stop:551 length:210 start_codon:yes stop_codon:yes gene_type:complete